MQIDFNPIKPDKDCSTCQYIPHYQFAEIQHSKERLPEEIHTLEIIGGYGVYGSEQIRKCSECGSYYTYLYDKGIQVGLKKTTFTDNEIKRLSAQQALYIMEKIIKTSENSLQHWNRRYSQNENEIAFQNMERHKRELQNLKDEIYLLKNQGIIPQL